MYPVSYDLARALHADRTRALRRHARSRSVAGAPDEGSVSGLAGLARRFGRRAR